MPLVIGESYEDIRVLLEVLSGEHRLTPAERSLNVTIGLAMGIGGVAVGVSGWSEDAFFAAFLMLLGIAAFLGLWQHSRMRQTFTPEGIEYRAPMNHWFARAGEIRRVELVPAQSDWKLVVTRLDGERYNLEITPTMKRALETLYPDFFAPAALPKWMAYVVYAAIAAALLTAAIAFVWSAG